MPGGFTRENPGMSVRGGIDLGGTKIQAVVIDDDGGVLGQSRHPTPTSGGPPEVAAAMAEALRAAADEAGVATRALDGAGVGSPGSVDGPAGTVAEARNLPDWEAPYPLRDVLAEALGTRVWIGNDVQVATDAEFALGAARPYRSILGVFWGTGVGGGIVLDGRPWVQRSAGELGHVVVRVGGRRCPCGRRGCMEAYAGRLALERRAHKLRAKGVHTELFSIMRKRQRDRLTSGVWDRALRSGDALAHRLIDEAIVALGAGVASAVNLLGVEAVIIGGGMGIRLGEPYARRIESAMLPHVFADADPPDVRLAALGDLGGAIGASLLVEAAAPVAAVPDGAARSTG
jgi:glucokinase